MACFCILPLYSHQCEPVRLVECAAVFPQPYYIPVDDRELNFDIVTEISDHFCRNALLIHACFFASPPCDNETGAGLPR